MKVIFVTREGYDLSGARVRCYNFSRELAKQGIEARVFSFADDLGAKYGEKELKMSGLEKIRLNIRAFLSLIKESSETIFILQRLNYHTLAPLLVSGLKKNKVVFDCDDWNIRENPVYFFGFYPSSKMEYATRQITKHASVCIAASKFLEDYLLDFNPSVHYLPTGADTNLFCPREGCPRTSVVFSWIGTAYHEEMGANIRFLLDCFSKVADRHENILLNLAGKGKYFEEMRQTLPGYKHRNKVVAHAWIHPDRIPDHLSGTDVGLLPLIQDTKFNKAKSPTKLFEYMSMAKPTVANDVGEARNILRDQETGFLAKNKNEFVSAMCRLAENPQLCREMGHRARRNAERYYSLEVLGKRLADILKGI
ncbi:MAG: glycosyltransferase family 4 protein [Candidatus Omnitrophota bacterium]|jgi:glycosyltransferase involved in cell wall biosynthesis